MSKSTKRSKRVSRPATPPRPTSSIPNGTRPAVRPVAPRARPRQRSWTIPALAGGAVAVIVIALVAVKFLILPSTASDPATVVPAAVMHDLASVPDSVSNQVGQGSVTALPIAVRDKPLVGTDGRPRVVYFGAEYCPYCAAERWGLIVALSRFGQFSGLHTARSAADDTFPLTPTFSFLGSSYQSKYIDFTSWELQSSQGHTLQSPTSQDQALMNKYDAAPYVSGTPGSIPFIDVANQYVSAGASFSPGVLDNHTWQEIASGLTNANSDQTKGIVGTANVFTAAICTATGDSPSNVCGQPAIKQIEAQLAKSPTVKGNG